MSRDAILDMVVKNGLSEEVTIKHKIERNEEESHGYTWGKSVPGRMNSKYKGPGAGLGSTSCRGGGTRGRWCGYSKKPRAVGE